MDDSKITDFIIKITFGKLEPMQPHVKAIVEQLVKTAVIFGICLISCMYAIIAILIYFFG